MNHTEATEAIEKDQQVETDHLTATDIQIQAAAAETDHKAETDIQEKKHLLTISRQNINTLRPRDEPKRRNNHRRIYGLGIQVKLYLIHVTTNNLQPI